MGKKIESSQKLWHYEIITFHLRLRLKLHVIWAPYKSLTCEKLCTNHHITTLAYLSRLRSSCHILPVILPENKLKFKSAHCRSTQKIHLCKIMHCLDHATYQISIKLIKQLHYVEVMIRWGFCAQGVLLSVFLPCRLLRLETKGR